MTVQKILYGVFLIAVSGGWCLADEAIETKVDKLLNRMNLEEKIRLLSGDETGFNGEGLERLGIPKLRMADGPIGVRPVDIANDEATALPASVNLAASWDTGLARRYGQVLAEETKAKGKHVILGPCICIHRFPLSGRNFENYGEDPYLTSRMAVNYIEGVQGEGVVATAKHFAVNDQEWERFNLDVLIDERALREIHLVPFEYAVKEAGVYAVMNSYNLVNGQHASENRHLLTDILKGDWGFNGFVVSDWGSVYSTVEAANNGLDLEMPRAAWFGDKLLEAVKAGQVSEATIDDKVRRLLRVRFEAGVFDHPNPPQDESVIRSAAHRRFALEAAQKSIVLLKNDKTLPLDKSGLKKIAVIGPENADRVRAGGGGSSMVKPWHSVSPLEGITRLCGDDVEVVFARGTNIGLEGFRAIPGDCLKTPDAQQPGLFGEYYNNSSLEGRPEFTRVDKEVFFAYENRGPAKSLDSDHFSVRWSGLLVPRKTGKHVLGIASDDGSVLYVDDQPVIDNGGAHGEFLKTCEMDLTAGRTYRIRVQYSELGGNASMKLVWKEPGMFDRDPDLQEAVDLARESDAAIVCVGNNANREGEGSDVQGFRMAGKQAELIKAVAAVNHRTIVVLYGGTPIYARDWIDEVAGAVAAMYPGQEGGQALAQILFGDVYPSAKLPFSYIQSEDETYAFDGYRDPSIKMPYKEGVFVGYRYYDKHDIDPLFEFGYGLSYTTFEYSDLKVDGTKRVSVTVRNTGRAAGEEVVQLYVSPPKSRVERPVRELKGFAKVALKPGESKTVRMELEPRSFQYYDVQARDWAADSGTYEIQVGASSRDIRLTKQVELK